MIAEVKELPSRVFIFVDDNLTADRDYAKRLFAALKPLRKRWATQSTLAIADDPDLVRMMAEAGCIGIFAGLETFSDDNLGSVNKTCHRVQQYREAIQLLHRHGIIVEAGIVFGFDGDGRDVFRRTLKTLDDLEVDVIQVSIFTPLPGTPRAKLLADRIFDRNWEDYDFHHTVFQPAHMSSRDLQAGHDWVTRQFYRPWRIVRRLWRHLQRPGAWPRCSTWRPLMPPTLDAPFAGGFEAGIPPQVHRLTAILWHARTELRTFRAACTSRETPHKVSAQTA